jgi:cell wall-associated NlpC family hydrolase
MTREAIVKEALSWIKTPYHPMGKIKGVGTDCGQILVEVYGNVGFITKFDTGYYPIDFNQHRDTENYFKFIEQYSHKVDEPKNGDIVLYRFGRCISHSGIIVDVENKIIVHAQMKVGVVTSRWDDGDLDGRIVGFWSVI